MEFCHISEPFLVRGLCIELPVKYVFGNILRILSPAGTTIVCIFYRRLYVKLTADPQDSFIIGLYAMITFQFIPDPPVSLVWGIFVDLFYFICYPVVFQLAFRCLPMQPFIIRRMRNTSKPAQAPDGIPMIFVFLFYRPVYGFMPDQAQPRLLSISSSFFKKDISISARSFSACSSFTSARSLSSSLISSGAFLFPLRSFRAFTPPDSYFMV